ncbi:MAG: nitrous oxide reductase family maturation protein NosD [gamma proteobacterium symbiont of Taylorina sp.]|nr:nitrous oxide reductase family maturation protein NosD [gamma proteobacterium symbiont of Taylorina sp.]
MAANFQFYLIIIFVLLIQKSAFALPPLQLYVELTPPGGILQPEPGHYSGPVVLTRPITIDGRGQVTVDAERYGSVITIEANNTTLRGLHITNSGESFDKTHAGITIKADNTLIENNIIDNTLFGINVLGSNDNIIRNNSITSIETSLSLRGDGLRMWNSHDNLIENNQFNKVRDIYITNSENNRFISNQISHSRIGFELVFSHENEITANTIKHNATGLMLIYSNNLLINKNHISHLRSVSGSAMAFKESNNIRILENEVLHCAVGMSANAPLDPENILTIKDNHFIYNDIAMYFYGERGGHIIHNNHFEANILNIQASSPRASFYNNWKNNLWDTYEGFDNNNDGYGDTAFELYSWSDRLWVDRPMTQFFRGSPMLEMIDFMERLTSFSEPTVMLRDKTPKFHHSSQ